MKHALLFASLIVAVTVSAPAGPAAQGSEDLARRQYESGRSFVQKGSFAEALKDFQAVVDSFPQSAYADDALLDIALYHLEVARDQAAAQAAADRLLKEYPASDSAPMAYVLVGRLTIAKSRTPASIDTALASFERVPRLFPSSPAVAAARFYTGDTLRLARRTDDAVPHFHRVTLEYPRSVWAARADLAAAANLVASDRATQAFARLQRIRQQFPGSPEAEMALNFNTILYRLYVRKPAPFAFSGRFIGGEKDRFRDIAGVAVDDAGRILLGHRQGISIFDPKGTLVRTVVAVEPSAFFVEARDRVVVIRDGILLPERLPAVGVMVPVPNKVPRQLEDVPSAITLSGGDRLVADRKGKNVVRISQAGKFLATFAAVDAERLVRNELDDVAMIDRESKGIVIADRDGRVLSRIPAKGPNYQFDDPADLAFDLLGHLYVLDSRKVAIYVFGPKNRLLTTIASAGREPGSLQKPRAMAIDAAGRLYVFDESSQRIQVYQ
ncbi:MAG TPA: outer membrane protein assembly factor BamD [Vicinamibacterales bacterium]|nr:outer membrane protein assembly factor BamD [Vicinamibacterales bacterium]